jgi:hypothetical protein
METALRLEQCLLREEDVTFFTERKVDKNVQRRDWRRI